MYFRSSIYKRLVKRASEVTSVYSSVIYTYWYAVADVCNIIAYLESESLRPEVNCVRVTGERKMCFLPLSKTNYTCVYKAARIRITLIKSLFVIKRA